MNQEFAAEWIKYRRTLTWWIIVCWPLLLVLAEAVLMPSDHIWSTKLMNTFNWWSIIGMSIMVTLLAELSQFYERRSNSWNVLCTRSIRPSRLYLAKYLVVAIQLLVASVLFGTYVVLVNFLFWGLPNSVPWGELIEGLVFVWIAVLPQLAIMLWLAVRVSLGLAVGWGFIGMFVGMIVAEKPYWFIMPWAWSGRILMPIFGFNINGLPLQKGSVFWNQDVIFVGLILSVVVTAIVVTLSAFLFERREVK